MDADAARQRLAAGRRALAAGASADALTHYQPAQAATDPAIALAAGLGVAVCFARQRRWDAAEVTLTDLAERFPASGVALAYLAAVQFERGAVAVAEHTFVRAATVEPDAALVFVKRGEMRVRLGLLREGLADLQHASRLGGLDDPTQTHLRSLHVAVRRQLATALDRPTPRLRFGWRWGRTALCPDPTRRLGEAG